MDLEIQTGKVPGAVSRTTPAQRPAFIGLLILGLLGIILMMTTLVFWAVADGANSASDLDPAIPRVSFSILGFKEVEFFLSEQALISFWIAIIFFSLTYMIFLYQRFFRDHVTIYKKRFRKWEDEGVQLHD